MKKVTAIIATGIAAVLLIGSVAVIASEKRQPQRRSPRQQVEMTEEQKAEMKAKMQDKAKEKLAKQLEEGKITQEQYDEQLAKIEAGEFNFGGKGRSEKPQRKEMTEEEKAKMKAKMQDKAKEKLAKQLEEGKITQEQYDEQLAKIEAGEFEFGSRPGGKRGHGGRGVNGFKGGNGAPQKPEAVKEASEAAAE